MECGCRRATERKRCWLRGTVMMVMEHFLASIIMFSLASPQSVGISSVFHNPPTPPAFTPLPFSSQFDKLADQLLDLPMDSLKMLRTLVQAVFDKALDEPTFVDMYADLCVRLNERSTSWSFVKVRCVYTYFSPAARFSPFDAPKRLRAD